MALYLPEGFLSATPENRAYLSSEAAFREAAARGVILEARAELCDCAHDLIVDLGFARGVIPREEGALGIAEGKTRDVALISRVNKPVCFVPLALERDGAGALTARLSRKAAQRRCQDDFLARLAPGDVIGARVTYLETFGCFVDVGCGIPSLIPIDQISVSRIAHPRDRFAVGEDILAVVRAREGERLFLSHKELLGTWEENAALFHAGETVSGVIRSVEEYGVFVELTPNLAGLAEPRADARPGQRAAVYIKSILPDRMKVKLVITDAFDAPEERAPLRYFFTGEHLSRWRYSPESCARRIETVFA